MTQYGFFIDTSRCIGCNACVLACKQWHDIAPGPAKPIRVHQWEKGAFPDLDVNVVPIMCMHCSHPRCVDACENGAIFKEDKYGAVLVDAAKCQGDRNCYAACPYGSPQFMSDNSDEKMIKCDMCYDRLEEGKSPICVLSCSMRALDFGPLDQLREKYGDAGTYIAAQEPPCKNACPAGVNAQAYINHIAEGDLQAALREYFKITPFAGVLGRICTHACEIDCFRGRFDEAVAIRELKRYMADIEDPYADALLPEKQPLNGKKVAVIGAGPSGLACAYQLALRGYVCDVFEEKEKAGGMMRYGVPDYRLPAAVLDQDISFVIKAGARIHTNTKISDVNELLQDYDAVYAATGCEKGLKLNVPGEDNPHIRSAVSFLFNLNSGKPETIGDRVTVIGGGNVAMDAARSAIRLGAQHVDVISLEILDFTSTDRMPAQEEEVKEAREEGVIFHPGYGIERFEQTASGIKVLCNKCVSVRDENGHFSPVYAPLQEDFSIITDDVLVAIGQRSDEGAFPTGLPKGPRGPVMKQFFESTAPGMFAGGDLTSGPSDCISAIAAGNEAAESIDRYIHGKPIDDLRRTIPSSNRLRVEKKSISSCSIDPDLRRKTFSESTCTIGELTAKEQAERCLRCGSLIPSALFRREQPKHQIIEWDRSEALRLWMKRHPENGEELPDIFDGIDEVLATPDRDIFCRNKLVLKPANSYEKMIHTTDDE